MIITAKCGHPNSTLVNVEGYDDNLSALEDSTIRFSCPPGMELIGPDSATCTGNGEWEPDLSRLMCEDLQGN